MPKLKPEECLACVLHSRTSLKKLMPSLLKAREKALDATDDDAEQDTIHQEFEKAISDLNITQTEDLDGELDGELSDGMWDIYYDKDDDLYYIQEIL